MKRFSVLLMAAMLVLGSVSAALAIDVQVSGTWDFGGGYAKNAGNDAFYTRKHNGSPDDPFSFQQRIRTQFDFIASESLKGVLGFEIGTILWGSNNGNGSVGQGSGGSLDADGVNIETRRAYLNWMVPNTQLNIQMGIQNIALPSAAFGNPILDADVAGVVASYKFNDMVTATGFWARPFDRSATDATKNLHDEMDVFGVTVPVTLDGYSLTPYAVYSRIGGDSGFTQYRLGEDLKDTAFDYAGSSNAWWVGGAFEISVLDPISIKLDGMYGQLKGRNDSRNGSGDKSPEYKGWHVSGMVEYKTQSMWGTPGALGWYASGDKSDDWKDGKYSRMPIIGNDNNGFVPTAFGFPGSNGPLNDSVISNSGVGTWGAGLQLADMSFVEKLSHTVRVAYISGTNHKGMAAHIGRSGAMGDNVYLTKADNAIEVDFFSKYALYENLDVYLETAYIYMDRDKNSWGDDHSTSPAWKAQVLFQYSF